MRRVISDEIEAQLGVERAVEAMPPMVADAVLDHFDVTPKPRAAIQRAEGAR